MYIWIAVLIFVSFVYYNYGYLDSDTSEIDTINSEKIQNVQKNLMSPLEIQNSIENNDTNDSVAIVEDLNTTSEPKQEEVKEERTLKIVPKNKIWAGYIDIETNKKYQKIFTEEFALDVTKNWLLLFGSGTVKLEINGKIEKFSSVENMRFKYVDGEFTKITLEEFKSLNKGRKW